MKLSVAKIVDIPQIQPYGGYIPAKNLVEEPLTDQPHYIKLVDMTCKMGTLTPQSLGLMFDYMLRTDMATMAGEDPGDAVINAFYVSFLGAKLINKLDEAKALGREIAKLYGEKKRSVTKIAQVASELVVYDAVYRAGYYNPDADKPKVSEGDTNALELMLGATEVYFLYKEHLTSLGFGFTALGAEKVAPSDGDLLTTDSIIDLKCSVKKPNSKQTFQLLLYYILGMHENPKDFKKLKYLKILNPRLGKIYSYEIKNLNKEDLKTIERDVMGYRKSAF